MKPPVPPKDFRLDDSFGPLPKCKHGQINSICSLCNPELLKNS